VALRDLASGERGPLAALRGERVGLLAAIARPDRFERSLVALGAQVVARHLRGDHQSYGREEIASLDRSIAWVTTAKDAVKLPPDWARGREIRVLEEAVQADAAAPLADFVHEELDRREGRS
jgi:tetraacyldisaccharide 4'-kinase